MPQPDRNRRLTAFLVALAVLVAAPLAVVAADAFTDVPDTNVFHDDIAWLADANVTKGCNPPDNTEFCPGDNVTREQMAAFMRRLAQNKVVDAATAETADHATTADNAIAAEDTETLNGQPATAFQTLVVADGCRVPPNAMGSSCADDGAVDDDTVIELARVTLPAPSEGTVVISGYILASTLNWFTLNASCSVSEVGGPWGQALNGVMFGSLDLESHSATTAASIPAGDHVFRLCGFHQGNPDTDGIAASASLVGQFSPGGAVTIASEASGGGTPMDLQELFGG